MKKNKIGWEIILLVLPIIAENVLQISAGIVSTAMIGRLNSTDISGQGISMRITGVLWCLYKGIGVGATIMVARAYGEGAVKKVRSITSQAFATTVPLSLILSVFVMLFSLPILKILTDDRAILEQARKFMHIILFGFPFVVVMQIVTSAFHGHGDTKTPMIIALFVNITNFILGYLLIFGFHFIPALGIRGAAFGLILSQICGALLGLFLLYGKKGLYPRSENPSGSFRFNKETIREIYGLGLPASFESMFWQFSAIVMSRIILSFGEKTFAAYQLGLQAENLMEMPAIGFGMAATILSARAIGKGDHKLFKLYFRHLVLLTLAVSIVTSLLLILFPHLFMNLLTNKGDLMAIGISYIVIMGVIQIPQNLSRVYNGAIRAAGHTRIPMYIAGVGIWLIRIPAAYVGVYVFNLDIIFIWFCIASDQLIRFLLSFFIYRKKRIWDFNEIKEVRKGVV